MRQIKRIALIGTGVLMATVTSQATLTAVNGAPGDEWNLTGSVKGIMDTVYGAGNFTRVDDSTDVAWAGLNGVINFKAIYAGNSQALFTAGLGGSPESTVILSSPGSTAGITPSRDGNIATFTPAAQPFLFLDKSGGTLAYSDSALSTSLADRMVTFAVTGYMNSGSFVAFADGPHYVIAFEDGTDFDFNDLVVEVQGVAPVPEPTTMIAGALLLLPFGASALRILRKKIS